MQEHIAPPYFKVNLPLTYPPNQPQFVANADEDDILDDLFLEGEVPLEDNVNSWNPNYDAKSAGANSLNHPVQISLYHKQRGGKGTWKQIEPNELIRVTKGVGKKLKLVLKSATPLESSQVHITLLDVGQPEELNDKNYQVSNMMLSAMPSGTAEPLFVVESEQLKLGSGAQLEYELKLFQLSKTLCFQVALARHGETVTLRSVLFGTHNSGKQKKKKDDDESPRSAPNMGNAAPSTALNTSQNGNRLRKMSIDAVHEDEHVIVPDHAVRGSLDVLGVMKARGFVQYSDVTLKMSFEDLSEALEHVLRLEGKTFEWKAEALGEEPHTRQYSSGRVVCGLIAQHVATVVPEATRRDERGVWAITAAPLIALLVEALKSHVTRWGQDAISRRGDLTRLKSVLSSLDSNVDLLPSLRADLDRLARLVSGHVTGETHAPSWLQRLKLKMTIFGKRRVSSEARLGAQLVVVLVCRKDHVIQQSCKDFFMVLYKHDTLIADQYIPLGKHRQARALPVRVDHVTGGDFQGTYTVVIGGTQAQQCCAEGGIITVYDFRREDSASAPNFVMRMQLCQPIPLRADRAEEQSALWIVGRFKLTHAPAESTWMPAQTAHVTQNNHVPTASYSAPSPQYNNNVPQYQYYAPSPQAVYNFNGPTFVMPAQVPPPPSPLQPQSAGLTQQFLSHPLFVQKTLPHVQANIIYTDTHERIVQ